MTVKLMLTCLCDGFYGEVGIATVRVLEHAGCTVEFPKAQTCCGQPPFNAGDWESARKIARHWRQVFGQPGNSDQVSNNSFLQSSGNSQSEIPNLKFQISNSTFQTEDRHPSDPAIQQPSSRAIEQSSTPSLQDSVAPTSAIVTPSSSCAAMIREGYPLLFGFEEHVAVYELGEFLTRQLGIEKWPLGFTPGVLRKTSLAYHRACHGRALGLRDEQENLLRSIEGVELVPIDQPEQCCGFGGAFSVGHPTVSAGIGLEKLKHVIQSGAKTLVSGDMGCLMHLRGLIERHELDLQTKHFAEVLADAIPMEVPA